MGGEWTANENDVQVPGAVVVRVGGHEAEVVSWDDGGWLEGCGEVEKFHVDGVLDEGGGHVGAEEFDCVHEGRGEVAEDVDAHYVG